jgi:hypothetical protein
VILASAFQAEAQTPLSYRGFLDGRGVLFPQDAPNDDQNLIGDLTARGEVFFEPSAWLLLAAGVDVRGNTNDHVSSDWTPDLTDQSIARPPLSIRRLMASFHGGPLTLDIGRQFIRWGRTDVLVPTDRFAPRDYLNVIDNDFLAVNAVRTRLSNGFDSLDVVWLPIFTPSRIPLLDQRWTVRPRNALPVQLIERDDDLPGRWQAGIRWERVAPGYELAVGYSDGFSHLPVIAPAEAWQFTPFVPVVRRFPRQRMVGGDGAISTRWFTLKGEAGLFGSPDELIDDYVLYVVQIERQTGEWLLIGGYAGEMVTTGREAALFAPDRGVAKSFLGSASYTIDATRSVAFEGALRQNGQGLYLEAEYSQSAGQHWRTTVTGALLAGHDQDFFGQFQANSYVTAGVRFSF